MDIEKLIEQLRTESLYADKASLEIMDLCMDAADTLSTLQDENEKLLDKIEDARLEGYAKGLGEMSEENEQLRSDLRRLQTERDTLWAANQHLLAEREQLTAERDGAVDSIPRNCKTCAYHVVFFNGCTPDHDCTNPDGGCSNNYDRWEWRGIKEG